MSEIDHLVFAVGDLSAGIERVEALTGAAAALGGPHPGLGTHNALVAFDGGSSYLEIIAPDPGQPEPEAPRPFGLDDLVRPGIAGFAIHAGNGESADDVADRIRSTGCALAPMRSMSRVRPDGTELTWRLALPVVSTDPGPVPFVIDWGDTPTPARTSPSCGALVALRIAHPDADVRRVLGAIGLDASVVVDEGPASMSATIRTADGDVTLD